MLYLSRLIHNYKWQKHRLMEFLNLFLVFLKSCNIIIFQLELTTSTAIVEVTTSESKKEMETVEVKIKFMHDN